ncbi:YjgF-like protein [Geopyxis carbonaria]|nr:YjgF-like protein [Geopyxis carbonaria]
MAAPPLAVHKTANPYENAFGYSRAVRRGAHIFVSGTTSLDPKTHFIRHPRDARAQTRCALEESLNAIGKLGGNIGDVVRVRLFVKRQEDTDTVGEAMKELFEGRCEWAATMIVGVGFVDEEMMVEVEVEAIVG